MPDLKNLKTAKEIAPLLGRGARAIQKRAAKGEIPCYRIGGIYLFDIKEIEGWIKNNYHPVTENVKK